MKIIFCFISGVVLGLFVSVLFYKYNFTTVTEENIKKEQACSSCPEFTPENCKFLLSEFSKNKSGSNFNKPILAKSSNKNDYHQEGLISNRDRATKTHLSKNHEQNVGKTTGEKKHEEDDRLKEEFNEKIEQLLPEHIRDRIIDPNMEGLSERQRVERQMKLEEMERFTEEEIDLDWKNEIENSVAMASQESDVIGSFEIIKVECRTDSCLIYGLELVENGTKIFQNSLKNYGVSSQFGYISVQAMGTDGAYIEVVIWLSKRKRNEAN